MKKVIYVLLVLSFIVTASCNKTNGSSNYWSFNGTTFNTSSNQSQGGSYTFSSISPVGGLMIYFSSATPTSGTYTIGAGGASSSSTQVGIDLVTSSGTLYGSTGTGLVIVTVGSNGRVAISGNAMLINNSGSNDSSSVSIHVTQ